MLVGYARVSTGQQNLDLQIDALQKADCTRIFTDKISGAKAERKGLTEAIDFMRKGDTLVVWKLDRLGRTLKHLIATIEDLNKRGIDFKSLKENLDTSTSSGKLIFNVMGALAEFERDVIRERVNAGLAAARARGKLGGRKKLLDAKTVDLLIKLYQAKEQSATDLARMFGISRSILYVYLQRAEDEQA